MALLTVEGVYDDGKIELRELPDDVPPQSRVLVTFLPLADAHGVVGKDHVHETERREATARLLTRLREGIDFGGPPYPKREELYDRAHRYDERAG